MPVRLGDPPALPGEEMTSLPPGLSGPARRALAAAGLDSLEDVARFPRAELAALHGMGPKALQVLDNALAAERLAEGSALDDRAESG
jgi:hypothetical protein